MVTQQSKRYAALFIAFGAGLLLFTCKVRFDNKYLSIAPIQEATGVTDLRGDVLHNARSPLYLCDGWAFYPGQCLTTDGTSDTLPPPIRYDISTASRIPMEGGTYRLRLLVDERPSQYALERPWIQDNYRLWVNGDLLVDTWAPDSTQSPYAVLSFEASGTIDLQIFVGEPGVFRAGLNDPPGFGSPRMLWGLALWRLISAVSIMSYVLILAAFGFPFGIWINKLPLTLSQIFLCLFNLFSISRAAIRMLSFSGDTAILCCKMSYYGMLLTLLLTFGIVFQMPRKWIWTVGVLAGAQCILAGIISVLPFHHITALLVQYLTWEEWYGPLVCCVIILSALWAVRRGTVSRTFFLVSAGEVAAALLITALSPAYHPRWLQWPVESAILIHSWISVVAALFDIIHLYFDNVHVRAKEKSARQAAALETEKFQRLAQQIDQTRTFRHEMRAQLTALLCSARTGEYQQLERQITAFLGQTEHPAYSGNALIDTLFASLIPQARLSGIQISYDFSAIPPHLPFSDIDLCSLLSNVIENAIEGCERMPALSQRTLAIILKSQMGFFYLSCVNSYPDDVVPKKGLYATMKPDPELHGYGLPRIKEIVSRYNGFLQVEHNGIKFTLEAALPLQDFGVGSSAQEYRDPSHTGGSAK